jgi:hypothetical protein
MSPPFSHAYLLGPSLCVGVCAKGLLRETHCGCNYESVYHRCALSGAPFPGYVVHGTLLYAPNSIAAHCSMHPTRRTAPFVHDMHGTMAHAHRLTHERHRHLLVLFSSLPLPLLCVSPSTSVYPSLYVYHYLRTHLCVSVCVCVCVCVYVCLSMCMAVHWSAGTPPEIVHKCTHVYAQLQKCT